MPHDGRPHDHNHDHAGHLRSCLPGVDRAEALQALAEQFIEGFQAAPDKTAYLRLAGVPFERPCRAGPTAQKLVDVALRTAWQVGAASPAFGARALSYQPFPGAMVRERANMAFVYVSLDVREEVDLRDFLAAHPAAAG